MPGADAFITAIRDADAILFVTPEYNGSIPGVLKNAIDWASRPTPATSPLANKPVAVIGASTGMFGATWAQTELRKSLGLAGARVLDHELAVPTAHEAFHDDVDWHAAQPAGGYERSSQTSSPRPNSVASRRRPNPPPLERRKTAMIRTPRNTAPTLQQVPARANACGPAPRHEARPAGQPR